MRRQVDAASRQRHMVERERGHERRRHRSLSSSPWSRKRLTTERMSSPSVKRYHGSVDMTGNAQRRREFHYRTGTSATNRSTMTATTTSATTTAASNHYSHHYRERGWHSPRRASQKRDGSRSCNDERRRRRRSDSSNHRQSDRHRRDSNSRNGYSDQLSVRSDYTESEHERRVRWEEMWEQTKHEQPPRPQFTPLSHFPKRRGVLEIAYWERTPDNALRKQAHMDQLDQVTNMSREEWILNTTLRGVHVTMEPNLFPYETPAGVMHYTLWSRTYLKDDEVESFVEEWLDLNRPSVEAWAWDPSNLSEGMSIDLYHVHVFMWERPKMVATFKPSTRSHKASLPPPASPPPSPYADDPRCSRDRSQHLSRRSHGQRWNQ